VHAHSGARTPARRRIERNLRGQHRVPANLFDDGAELRHRVRDVDPGAVALPVPEPVVLGDPEDLQAARRLTGAAETVPSSSTPDAGAVITRLLPW
jgi:hypothetical protein